MLERLQNLFSRVSQTLSILHDLPALSPREEMFRYAGYEIPVRLVNLTGGGPDTWEVISQGHMEQYRKYCPIEPEHLVLELGCGVGRDAIQLTQLLSPKGHYLGIDIIRPSIEWCQKNITPRYPNFRFTHFDIKSQIHNAVGSIKTTDVRLPLPDQSTDRILLQSVFTHLFEPDILHYLKEFRRVLKPDGLVCASFFLFDDETLARTRTSPLGLTFLHPYGEGCRINDPKHPEGAVAYTLPVLERLFSAADLELARPISRGFWSGREGSSDGQDMVILRRRGLEASAMT